MKMNFKLLDLMQMLKSKTPDQEISRNLSQDESYYNMEHRSHSASDMDVLNDTYMKSQMEWTQKSMIDLRHSVKHRF